MHTSALEAAVAADSRYQKIDHVLTCSGRTDPMDPERVHIREILLGDLQRRAGIDPDVAADSRYQHVDHVLACSGRTDLNDSERVRTRQILQWDIRSRAMETTQA